jgi:hypothetical protein
MMKYPSIFGTHNGTITPNQTITVSKLYTYSCPSTGGHIEYMKIRNNSGGGINGTEFVDANGKKYNDGMPAIKLFH